MSTITYEGKEYRLVGQEQGECLIKCGTKVLLWYKKGKREYHHTFTATMALWPCPAVSYKPAIQQVVELPKRYAALVAAEKRLPPSVERAFARGTMAFAVEVE